MKYSCDDATSISESKSHDPVMSLVLECVCFDMKHTSQKGQQWRTAESCELDLKRSLRVIRVSMHFEKLLSPSNAQLNVWLPDRCIDFSGRCGRPHILQVPGSIQFKSICVAVFTIHIASRQLYRKRLFQSYDLGSILLSARGECVIWQWCTAVMLRG